MLCVLTYAVEHAEEVCRRSKIDLRPTALSVLGTRMWLKSRYFFYSVDSCLVRIVICMRKYTQHTLISVSAHVVSVTLHTVSASMGGLESLNI